MFLSISIADERGEFPKAKPFRGKELTQLFLKYPTPSTVHHHHYQLIKKIYSSVNTSLCTLVKVVPDVLVCSSSVACHSWQWQLISAP